MQFVIHFEDEIFVGNPLGNRESGWSRLPEKPILVFEYILPYANILRNFLGRDYHRRAGYI